MLLNSASVALILAVALPAVSAKASTRSDNGSPDFGSCIPDLKFEEQAFLPVDSVVAEGQRAAVNPYIITNHICAQISSTCDANEAAQVLCQDVQAEMQGLGLEEGAFADTWNDLISGGSVPKFELVRRADRKLARRQIQFIPCSADAWVDNCTGWPRKRGEPIEEEAPVVKRSEVVKKAELTKKTTNVKRQIAFVPCSADAWVDNCTGWP